MSFEIQELLDIIKIITLVRLADEENLDKDILKNQLDNYCEGYICVETKDVDGALNELGREGLVIEQNHALKPTEKGIQLGKEWQNLLLKKEPILEVVAGLTDGSIASLVVILSTLLAGLTTVTAAFAAVLSLTSVAITNFSSFLLGGRTEDIADLLTLKNLMDYSLSDIPDKIEREKSLKLLEHMFKLLNKGRRRTNLFAAVISGITTFVAGLVPIVTFLTLPKPFNLIISLGVVIAIAGVFLVRYRSHRAKIHWGITLIETIVIIAVAVVVSLLIGHGF
ncbi:MAG: VIT1/CCC1 transporter family protein [Nitrososphaeria archaeon]